MRVRQASPWSKAGFEAPPKLGRLGPPISATVDGNPDSITVNHSTAIGITAAQVCKHQAGEVGVTSRHLLAISHKTHCGSRGLQR